MLVIAIGHPWIEGKGIAKHHPKSPAMFEFAGVTIGDGGDSHSVPEAAKGIGAIEAVGRIGSDKQDGRHKLYAEGVRESAEKGFEFRQRSAKGCHAAVCDRRQAASSPSIASPNSMLGSTNTGFHAFITCFPWPLRCA